MSQHGLRVASAEECRSRCRRRHTRPIRCMRRRGLTSCHRRPPAIGASPGPGSGGGESSWTRAPGCALARPDGVDPDHLESPRDGASVKVLARAAAESAHRSGTTAGSTIMERGCRHASPNRRSLPWPRVRMFCRPGRRAAPRAGRLCAGRTRLRAATDRDQPDGAARRPGPGRRSHPLAVARCRCAAGPCHAVRRREAGGSWVGVPVPRRHRARRWRSPATYPGAATSVSSSASPPPAGNRAVTPRSSSGPRSRRPTVR